MHSKIGGITPRYTITINPTPADATVVLTSTGETQEGNAIEVDKGSNVSYSVSKEGYTTQTGTESNVKANKTIAVTLEVAPEPTTPTEPTDPTEP